MKKLLLAFALLTFSFPAHAAPKETAYERVMRTGTLRCGYILLPPEMSKDLKTGQLSGLSYDITEEIGRRLHLKIDWAEEVNFQTLAEGLKTNRYDAVCFSLYRYSQQIPFLDFSSPLFYSGTGIYVRADDQRFDKGLAALNSPDIKISAVDGEMSAFIAAEDFPKAKILSLPQFTDMSQAMLNVETKKADVTFVNGLVAAPYLKANPGKLKNIASKDPIRVFSHGFAFGKGQYDLVRMISLTIEEMHDHGFIQKTLDKYDASGKDYLRVQKTYGVK